MRPSARAYWIVLLILTGIFAGLTYYSLWSDEDDTRARAPAVASAVIIGPFTGAMARNWQGCCTEFSLWLLPWAIGFLGIGIGTQFLPLPPRRWSRALKLIAWGIGVFGWYATGIFSFLHALN
jgi:hypothetical protein